MYVGAASAPWFRHCGLIAYNYEIMRPMAQIHLLPKQCELIQFETELQAHLLTGRGVVVDHLFGRDAQMNFP